METLVKEELVSGYIRETELEYRYFRDNQFVKTLIIPNAIIWLIRLYIADNDEIFDQFFVDTRTREIIVISVGGCGINMANDFWHLLLKEHKLQNDGAFNEKPHYGDNMLRLDKIDVYFQETSGVFFQESMKFVPRACLIDFDPNVNDTIKSSSIGSIFKPDNIISSTGSCGNNYAKGHYTNGAEFIDESFDVIRKEIESCNCLQGIQMTHSIGGGTGSGFAALLLSKIRDNFPDRVLANYTVFPSPRVSDVVVEPYNAILSINQLLENSDQTSVIDNEALFNISHNILKQNKPKYSDLNWVISMVMSATTASLRFSVKLHNDLRKLGVNIVPFPRLHFFLLSYAPLFAAGHGDRIRLTVQRLTDQMWSSRNYMANVKAEDGLFLCAAMMYHGPMATREVDDETAKIQQKFADEFVTWIPNNIKASMCIIGPVYTAMGGSFIGNTTAIKGVFQRVSAQFAKMYKRKAFLHWYKDNGMDEMEFEEADKNVRDLITEYQDKQDAVVDLEYYDDYDESDEDEYDDDEEEEEEEDT